MKAGHGYRPDIDGLRAVAVLAVLAYHAFPDYVGGGFVGVDIFFVISGFLISGIIFSKVKDHRFSILDFYWRRIRRIFPALLLVLATCLFLGWSLLLPDEFENLGKHIAAGAGFVSNLILWREVGYFDTASETKGLLHLWSLGVEEQFYLVWPVLIWMIRSKTGLGLLVLAITLLSFASNIVLIRIDPSATFYLPFTRFWQLMVGAFLAYLASYTDISKSGIMRHGSCDAQSTVGAILIGVSIAFFESDAIYPGWRAVLPTVGAALVISAGQQSWINRNILSANRLVYIGLISYPLYVWHWPLLVFLRVIEDGSEPSSGARVTVLCISFLLSILTYEIVEQKVRTARSWRRLRLPPIGVGLCTAMVATGSLGLLIKLGYFDALAAKNRFLSEVSAAASDNQYGGDGIIKGKRADAVLLFGDSHMQHYLPRLLYLRDTQIQDFKTAIIHTRGGCAPIPGIERSGRNCAGFVTRGLDLGHRPDVRTVVISASWRGLMLREDYFKVGDATKRTVKPLQPDTGWIMEGFERELESFVDSGKDVVIILSSPRGSNLHPKSLVDHTWTGVQAADASEIKRHGVKRVFAPIDRELVEIAERLDLSVIDPASWLCSENFCPATDEEGNPIYRDATHVRARISRLEFDALDQFLLH